MSRLIVRSAISNFGRLAISGASASLKSKGILRVACQGVMKCDSKMMSSMNRRFDEASDMSNKEFVECLEDSIREEQVILEPIGSRIGNFEVISMKDADVELKGKYLNEEIKIKFNINGVLVDQSADPEQENDVEEPMFDADLTFTVEINRGKGKNLLIQCGFGEMENEGQSEKCVDIQMFAMVENGQEVTDKTYTCYDEIMDENIHNYLMNLLEKRGINSDFIDKLKDWTLNYDRKSYVKLLGSLKDFVSA